MRKTILLLLAIIGLTSFQSEAQRRYRVKRVAVFVTGDVDKRDKTVIGSTVVTALTYSEDYTAVERTDEFVAALNKMGDYEQQYVDTRDIASIGQQLGMDYIALIKVESSRRETFIAAQLIDAETGEVIKSSTEVGYAETMQELRELAREVSVRLLGLSSGASNGNSGVGSGRGRGQSGQNRTFTVNGVTFEMVAVRGGSFMMGSNEGYTDERPVHHETVSDFMIGKTEVTQELWRAVMGRNPSYFSGDRKPVEEVSWTDCIAFIGRLNQLTGENFRLPTEAEWEYAARGGNKSHNYTYSGGNDLYLVGWFNGNSGDRTHEVGTLQANELGIYDMSGNVYEWTVDQWSANYDYIILSDSSFRVVRGGSFGSDAARCRVAYRGNQTPDTTSMGVGLRLAL